MLVLSRKVGERLLIGDDIVVVVVRVSQGVVRLGIDAPKEIAIAREEVAGRGVDSEDGRKSIYGDDRCGH